MSPGKSFGDYAARLRGFIRQPSPPDAIDIPPSPAEAEVHFDSLAHELFAFQFAHNVPYRRFCQARGVTPDGLTHWSDIPAMPTAAFKELELTCLPGAERTAVFHSSGTTEQRPSRHFHNADSLALYEASLAPWFAANVLNPPAAAEPDGAADSTFFLFLTPPPVLAPHSSLVYMFETVRRQFGTLDSKYAGQLDREGHWTIDRSRADAVLRHAELAHRTVSILGTAFSFVQLIDDLAERKIRFGLPADSRVMETGGYKGRSRALTKAELHARIEQYLGLPAGRIIGEYGMCELSSQAYQRIKAEGPVPTARSREPQAQTWQSGAASQVAAERRIGNKSQIANRNLQIDGPFFRFPPWARVRIVSPETGRAVNEGEAGLIQVFDLANVGSVMAVQTEDLGLKHGAGFDLVGRAAQSELRGCSLMA